MIPLKFKKKTKETKVINNLKMILTENDNELERQYERNNGQMNLIWPVLLSVMCQQKTIKTLKKWLFTFGKSCCHGNCSFKEQYLRVHWTYEVTYLWFLHPQPGTPTS